MAVRQVHRHHINFNSDLEERIEALEAQDGDKHFVYDQATPSDNWVITHSLGKHPAVTIIDSAGTQVMGCVTHTDTNTLEINFSSGFSGTAYLN